METSYPHGIMSWVIATGIVDCLALLVAVFGQLVDLTGTHPAVSLVILLLSSALLLLLVVAAVVDETRAPDDSAGAY